jgi:hypothetical protein
LKIEPSKRTVSEKHSGLGACENTFVGAQICRSKERSHIGKSGEMGECGRKIT